MRPQRLLDLRPFVIPRGPPQGQSKTDIKRPHAAGTIPTVSGVMSDKEKWCPGADSNHRHRDFQSRALPTELPGHMSSWKARIYVNSRALSSVPPDLNLFVVSIAQPALIDGRGFLGGNAVIAAQPAGQIDIRAAL